MLSYRNVSEEPVATKPRERGFTNQSCESALVSPFNADPDPDFYFNADLNPDPDQFLSMRIWIRILVRLKSNEKFNFKNMTNILEVGNR